MVRPLGAHHLLGGVEDGRADPAAAFARHDGEVDDREVGVVLQREAERDHADDAVAVVRRQPSGPPVDLGSREGEPGSLPGRPAVVDSVVRGRQSAGVPPRVQRGLVGRVDLAYLDAAHEGRA